MSKTIATSNGLMAKTTKMTKAAPQSNTQRGTRVMRRSQKGLWQEQEESKLQHH